MKTYVWIIIAVLGIVISVLAWEGLRNAVFPSEEPNTETTHSVVLEEIEALGRLELVKYTFRDVVEYTVERNYLPDSKVMLIVSGEAIGCVDFAKIQKGDITETDSRVIVTLPQPEICVTKINHQDTKVYDTQWTYFDAANLTDKAYKEAEKEIMNIAMKTNILEQTEENAKQLLKPLFEQVSNKGVTIKFEVGGTGEEINTEEKPS